MSRGPYKTATEQRSRLRLRELRNQHGYTQEQIADLMNTDQSVISKQESGTYTLDERQLRRYAQIYNIPISDLFEDSKRLSEEEQDLIDYMRAHPRDARIIQGTKNTLRENSRGTDYEAE